MENQIQPSNPQGSVLREATAGDDYVARKVAELIEQEGFRKRTIEIIVEHTDSVPFMKKVQEYADEQIDRRLFKNSKVVISVVIGWIVTGVVAYIVAKTTK